MHYKKYSSKITTELLLIGTYEAQSFLLRADNNPIPKVVENHTILRLNPWKQPCPSMRMVQNTCLPASACIPVFFLQPEDKLRQYQWGFL